MLAIMTSSSLDDFKLLIVLLAKLKVTFTGSHLDWECENVFIQEFLLNVNDRFGNRKRLWSRGLE